MLRAAILLSCAVYATATISTVKVTIQPEVPTVGGTMTVSCHVVATELTGVTYAWKHGTDVITGQTSSTLSFTSLTDAAHGGTKSYTCTATDASGASQEGASSNVDIVAYNAASAKPSSIISNKATTTVEYLDGNQYTLTCVSPAFITGTTYKWTTENPTATLTETTETITITAAPKSGTAKQYKCHTVFGGAESAASVGEDVDGTATASVSVNGPKSPLWGDATSYTCDIVKAANHASTVVTTWEWKKGDDSGTIGTATQATDLTLPADSTAGLKCIADSTASPVFDITPAANGGNDGAEITVAPTITQTGGESGKFQTGGSYTLTCSSDSYNKDKEPVWAWTSSTDGSTYTAMTATTTATYEISSAASTHQAHYKCKLTIKGTDGAAYPSPESAAHQVTVSDVLGVECADATIDTTCIAKFKTDSDKYTGNCVATRCQCTGQAIPDGCLSTASAIGSLSMALMVVMAMTTRLL